jgi:hypothetical protein
MRNASVARIEVGRARFFSGSGRAQSSYFGLRLEKFTKYARLKLGSGFT